MFFSLRTAYVLLLLLAGTFGLGTLMTSLREEALLFKQMNIASFFSLFSEYISHPLVLFWLVILVCVGAMLFLNTVCCTVRQISRYKKQRGFKGEAKRLGLIAIHLVAIVVIAFHAVDIALMERQKPQRIAVLQTAQLGDYSVRVEKLVYVTDRDVIRQQTKGQRIRLSQIPAEKFSIEENGVELSIHRDGELVQQKMLYMLQPFEYHGTFFILDGFQVPYGSEDDEIVALLHCTYNPLVQPFFLIYVLLLTILLLHGFKNRYRPASTKS